MNACINSFGVTDLNCTVMIEDNIAVIYKDMVTDFVSMFANGFEYNPWVFAIIGSIFVGLSGIFPLLIISVDDETNNKKGDGGRLKVLLSFAVGGLLGDVFLHLLPEAWANDVRNSPKVGGHPSMFSGLMLLSGMLLFIVVEKLFAGLTQTSAKLLDEPEKLNNNTKSPNKYTENGIRGSTLEKNQNKNGVHKNGVYPGHSPPPKPKHVAGYLNLMANCIDNFTHGLAVGGSFLISLRLGTLTTFAILIHEIPHEIGDFAILLKSGFTRWDAAKAQIITAGGGLVGSLVAVGSSGGSTSIDGQASWILPFTAGGFLHIALVTVLPDLLKEDNSKESIKQFGALMLGIIVMAGLTLIE